jgi:hypothetical protein
MLGFGYKIEDSRFGLLVDNDIYSYINSILYEDLKKIRELI